MLQVPWPQEATVVPLVNRASEPSSKMEVDVPASSLLVLERARELLTLTDLQTVVNLLRYLIFSRYSYLPDRRARSQQG